MNRRPGPAEMTTAWLVVLGGCMTFWALVVWAVAAL